MRSFFSTLLTLTGIGLFILFLHSESGAQLSFPDTLWVPVIFYDYHADGMADFETCEDPNSDEGKKGMIAPKLDAQRKPVPIPAVACPTNASSFPCACHLDEWFRVSGQDGSDISCIFKCDSLTDPNKPQWSWANLVPYKTRIGEYIGPNYNAEYAMANVIIYDSLCFLLAPGGNGVYQFADDDFLPLDGRGFGNEPPGLEDPHNFGFAMELHTKFKYQKGLSFSFRGDDDVWAFINDKLVMDLGGLHYYMDGFIDLDTIADLIPGQTYSFDLYYAERHSTGSHIHITSNVISASPSEVHITVFPNDTIKAGDTVTVIGTVKDEKGEAMPIPSDSIRWTQVQENVRGGDKIIIPRNDTTQFTATVAYRRVGIIGTYRSGTISIIDTAWIYIQPGDPSQVDISLQHATALTREQVITQIDTFAISPRQTVTLTMGQQHAYVYAVLRDRFGNFCHMADSSSWTSQTPVVATIDYTPGNAFEGIITRPAEVLNASATVIVFQESLTSDTAQIVMIADTLIALRLVDIAFPDVALDTVLLTVDSSVTVKVQGIWSTTPGVWTDVTGTWTLQPADAVTFSTPLPGSLAGQWTIAPSSSGSTQLIVQSLNISTSIAIVVKHITKLRLVNIDAPNKGISVISMTTDSTITVKLQGTWSTDPDTWVDLTGTWSLDPPSSIQFSIPIPNDKVGQWTLKPSTPGTTELTATSHGISESVPVIVSVADRQGPYIVHAVFTVGPLGGSFDTLHITFSEPITCNALKGTNDSPASSFKIFGPGDLLKTDIFDDAYFLDRGACTERFITEVTVMIKAKVGGIVPGKDSIVLYGSVMDTAGNYPDPTRRGPIVYGPGAGISVVPYTSSDPTSAPMVLPQEILDRFGIKEQQHQVKLIMIQTRGPLIPDTNATGEITYGKTMVYDPVANIVAIDLPILPTPFDDRLYYVLWNGTNRSKRRVASGAYLLKALVRYANKPESLVSLRAKFMIKWK